MIKCVDSPRSPPTPARSPHARFPPRARPHTPPPFCPPSTSESNNTRLSRASPQRESTPAYFPGGPFSRAASSSAYAPGARLGHGSFGDVVAAVAHSTGAPVALKRISAHHLSTPYKKAHTLEEVRLHARLTALRVPHLVRFLSAHIESSGDVVLAMEQCGGGDVYELAAGGPMREETARVVMAQLLTALGGMHAAGIIHRDVKPDNILKRGEGDYALCDFGVATDVSKPDLRNGLIGTQRYSAPEVVRSHAYSRAGDLWGCGVVLFSLLGSYAPFRVDRTGNAAFDTRELSKQICDLDVSLHFTHFPDRWAHVSAEAKALILRLLSKKPEDRPTAADALAHAWFAGTTAAGLGLTQPAPPLPRVTTRRALRIARKVACALGWRALVSRRRRGARARAAADDELTSDAQGKPALLPDSKECGGGDCPANPLVARVDRECATLSGGGGSVMSDGTAAQAEVSFSAFVA
jgi:hypothetical protein